MDEKYILELGKMTNSIENLIKNQDKHYSEIREMIQKQKDDTNLELRNLKNEIKIIERDRFSSELKLKERLDKAEKFNIKLIAYATILAAITTLIIKLLPSIIKLSQITPI